MAQRNQIVNGKSRKMIRPIRLRPVAILLMTAALLASLALSGSQQTASAQSGSIDLEEFRWSYTSFPLNVLVDMNQWSVSAYASVVHDTLDTWLASIWNYTASYDSTNLNAINYSIFFSDLNSTSNYDVFITFSPDEMPPGSSVVGLTVYDFNSFTHDPIPPITISVTTYSGTASNQFVKDVLMHEFGHALGLGHASSADTSKGPELMYPTSSKNEIVYPSTLDVYGLSQLYQGYFSQTIQLPSNIPYVMLLGGNPPPSPPGFLPSLPPFFRYIIVALIILGLVIIAVALINAGRKPPEEPAVETPPLAPSQMNIHGN